MALRFIDSFDHYATADLGLKYSATASAQITAQGRNGTSSGRSTAASFALTKVLDSRQEWVVGFAFEVTISLSATVIYEFMDSATTQCDVRINGSGQLIFTRNGTQLGSAGTTVIQANTYYYVEIKVKIDNTTGSFEILLNGVTETSGTGLDTQNTANATANTLRFRNSGGNSVDIHVDDYYICDTSGGTNNTFLGDVRVETIRPNGNGNSSQFVGSDGNSTDNYLLVDETTPNGDTDYVQGSTVGDKDTYTYGDLTPGSGTVHGVQIVPYARKTDAGSRSIKTVARLSATETDSADIALGTTYLFYPDIRETKPGGGAWTVSDVNGAEFGYKVSV